MDHTTYVLPFENAAVDPKVTQQGFGRGALFAGLCIIRDRLTITAFQNLVGLQGDLQLGYQSFHPSRRLQKHRPQLRGLFTVLTCPLLFTLAHKSLSAGAVGLCVVRSQANRLIQVGKGLVVFPLAEVSYSAMLVGFRKIRFDAQGNTQMT
jgi:hypothetical protein